MTERRPFPPSPRRLALARQAGLTAASPLVVGAVATVGALVAAVFLARAAAALVASWLTAACHAADGAAAAAAAPAGAPPTGSALAIADVAPRVLELAAPVLGVAAIAAFVAHVAQTRALWLPRRRITGAPVVEPARVRRTAFDILAAIIVGVVAFTWLWTTAPRLASLFVAGEPLAAVASALASFLAALAIAWLAIAVLDALVRRLEVDRALAMTVTEKREDDRLAAADPRWRAQRAALTRGPSPSAAVAQSAVVLLGDDLAVAIAWDPRRQPVPLRLASGRRAHATQLVGLARRHRIPVHRDAQLVTALEGEGVVPDAYWSRLAEIVAAVQGAHTGRDLSR